jgi:hypothetical protein
VSPAAKASRSEAGRGKLQREHLAGGQERLVAGHAVVAERDELGLDGGAPQPVDQMVGGRVVADRDHLLRVVAQGEGGARGLEAHVSAGEALPALVDRERRGPVDRVAADRLGQRAEHVELERRADRARLRGVQSVDLAAADDARVQRGVRGTALERRVDAAPGGDRAGERREEQALDQIRSGRRNGYGRLERRACACRELGDELVGALPLERAGHRHPLSCQSGERRDQLLRRDGRQERAREVLGEQRVGGSRRTVELGDDPLELPAGRCRGHRLERAGSARPARALRGRARRLRRTAAAREQRE